MLPTNDIQDIDVSIPSVSGDQPKTGPGVMMSFMTRTSDIHQEYEKLKAELTELKSSAQAKKIPASFIQRSKLANRHDQSFADADFKKLKAEIDSSGGNVQPIKVRPLKGTQGKFEIMFGHRRHQACLELGLPVLAMIDDATDQQLFAEMDRENRQRKDLRPYEQGLMYRRALDEGLFPSARKMAESIGVDVGNMCKSLSLARLPDVVLNAFRSPLDIQLLWASYLNKALENRPDIVMEIAVQIGLENPRPAAKVVLERLIATTGSVVSNNTPPIKQKFTGASSQSCTIIKDVNAMKFTIQFEHIDFDRMNELEIIIKDFIKVDA